MERIVKWKIWTRLEFRTCFRAFFWVTIFYDNLAHQSAPWAFNTSPFRDPEAFVYACMSGLSTETTEQSKSFDNTPEHTVKKTLLHPPEKPRQHGFKKQPFVRPWPVAFSEISSSIRSQISSVKIVRSVFTMPAPLWLTIASFGMLREAEQQRTRQFPKRNVHKL